MDNAGGAQVPLSVIDAVRDYMLTSYVQVGGEYPASIRAAQCVEDAHTMINTLMGGDRVGKTIFSGSTSVACRMLADCYADILQPGDEIVVAEAGHEANVGPWMNLAKRGFNVKLWRPNPQTGSCELAALQELLTDRTKVVAMIHVSNILGHVEDVMPCIRAAKDAGARVVLDGVAYAPHFAIDVEALGVDWYVFACYKVFGPHMAAMFGRHEAIAELTGPNHYFLPKEYVPGKFELGGPSHEACAALLGLRTYLQYLAGDERFSRETVVSAWQEMETLEHPLTAQLLEYLVGKPEVRVVGRAKAEAGRVPTIAFVHDRLQPVEIAGRAMEAGIGMRWGNFYSVRLLEALGIDSTSGVARVSLAHYNTPQEVDRLIEALDPIL